MKDAAQRKIFISYRVQDTAGETGRLVDALKQHFADNQIFMDIENLEPGADFTVAIENSLDSCDVFLAVIGPHWLSDRGGKNRINDPNDWVRMEVGTALQRNIRVVPVLVDGGTLPTADQLPPELQPLLRRQAIEISNRRWRYDTDQLIQFLIEKAGIPPLKAPLRQPEVVNTGAKKKKTWVYVVGGFSLAFVVLIIIGLFLPEEKNADGSTAGTQQSRPPADSVTSDLGTIVAPTHLTQSSPAEENQPRHAAKTVTGRWKEIDEGITSTFILKQAGTSVNVQVELNGQVISAGTGTVNNNNIELRFPLFGLATVVYATLSADKNIMNGTYVVQATGDEHPIQLVRKSN